MSFFLTLIDSGGIWDDMHAKMEKRRREWEDEVDRMRHDFFKLRPSDRMSGERELSNGTNGNRMLTADPTQMFVDGEKGDKKFRVSFDVSQFSPEEISVRTQDQKLLVHAKHEDTGDGKNVSREYSRQIDIPRHLDPEKLQCTLSKDGILQVEAAVPAPAYEKICSEAPKPFHSHGFTTSALPSQPVPQYSQVPLPTSVKTTHSAAPVPQTSPGSGFKTGPVLTEQDGARKLKMTVDIGAEFKPEEVLVKTVDRKLQISAKHEEKMQGRTTMREFSKELELPENVDPNSVTASMSEDGKLIIEAPMSSYTKGEYTGTPGSKKQPEITLAFT